MSGNAPKRKNDGRVQAILTFCCLLLGGTHQVYSFLPSSSLGPMSRRKPSSFYLVDDDQEVFFGSSILDSVKSTTDEESSFFNSLIDRQKELKNGIGKRYVARTQKGFLNIHFEPADPFDTDNIVGQLAEGQIVTSTGPSRGSWIPHDGGGWSVSKYQGFTWLEPIDE